MTNPQDLLAAGAAHHNAGRLAEAESHYRQALTLDPLNPDGLHLLGLIASAVGKLEVAEKLVRLAVVLRPEFPVACYNLGNIRHRRNRLEPALSAFRQAARLDPSPSNRVAAARTHAEVAIELAGGLATLNRDFNAVHRRNRAEPQWRNDALADRLGPAGRDRVLAHVAAAQDLAPNEDIVRHAGLLVFVAVGDLARGLAAMGDPAEDGNPEFGRLGAEVAWHLRRAEDARAQYQAFIRRKCQGAAPLRPMLAEVAAAPAFANRPQGPFPAEKRPVIVYTHYGNPDFLHHSIGQTLATNPGARVILIGDKDNRIDGVEHRLMQDFAAAADPVVSRYLHDSNNAYCYELFCIARWFLFLDLCRREDIAEMFLLDSDYMLFDDLSALAPRCREKGVGFSFNSAHFSYFRRDALEAFCRHVAGFFADGRDTGDFHRNNNSELFSDMAFIYDFQRQTPHVNFCAVEDASRFDYSITDAEDFHCSNGVKDIRFIDGLPYAFPRDGSRPIRFRGLHFQGLTKPMMRNAFFRQSWGAAAVGAGS